jgi:tRNA dimethylallyltransferase
LTNPGLDSGTRFPESSPGFVWRAVAVVGPTATGKSALALALAQRFHGEIVACDSTAVYRGIDIGTDKLPADEQRGIPHHLVDVVEPHETYSAARYGADAAVVIRAIAARGRLPVVAGGTGFYYRALVRGLFPGPARDGALRGRLERVALRKGPEALHRWLSKVDPPSGRRIQPRDTKRLVRALEVYLLTGRPLTAHFDQTASPIADFDVLTLGVRLPREALRARVSRRVEEQFRRGVVGEVQRLLSAGVPEDAHAFSGLVYRQVVELLRGVRDEAATRELIVRENMRYARRQMMWFRKEPGVRWLDGPGESPAAIEEATRLVEAFVSSPHVRPD